MSSAGKVLIINDEPQITERLAKWLRQNNYQYVFVDSEEEADVLLSQNIFHTVVRSREFLFPMGMLSLALRRPSPPQHLRHRLLPPL